MSAYDTPTTPCPYCKDPMAADWVDIGVGMQQCGPYHCDACGASEIGPEYTKVESALTPEERRTGYYHGGQISPHANQVDGVLVDYHTADAVYRMKYFAENGNPYNAPIVRPL